MESSAWAQHWEFISTSTFHMLEPRDLGRVAATSSSLRPLTQGEEIWRNLCRWRWGKRCWTAFTMRGLDALRRGEAPPVPESSNQQQEERDRWRSSWLYAYRHAEAAALRVSTLDLQGDMYGCPRVWVIHNCPPPFQGHNEAVLRPDMSYSDTALFRGVHGHYVIVEGVELDDGSDDHVGIQLFFAGRTVAGLFVAERDSTWGLRLRPRYRLGPDPSLDPVFEATNLPADKAWEERVSNMQPLLMRIS